MGKYKRKHWHFILISTLISFLSLDLVFFPAIAIYHFSFLETAKKCQIQLETTSWNTRKIKTIVFL